MGPQNFFLDTLKFEAYLVLVRGMHQELDNYWPSFKLGIFPGNATVSECVDEEAQQPCCIKLKL